MRMQRDQISDYSYSLLLGLSFLIAGIIWVMGALKSQEAQVVSSTFTEQTESISQQLKREIHGLADIFFMGQFVDVEEETEQTEQIAVIPDNLGIEEQIVAENEIDSTEAVEKDPIVIEETKEEIPIFYEADISYFHDALFIGDSRTVGLYEYGGLGDAEVFADTGMSIYKLFDKEFAMKTGEVVTLEDALSNEQFGKIYIMLGINELGYDFEQTLQRFSETIVRIREYQPDAYIFIQANLHITKEKAEESEYFTNENINRYNEAISKLADNKQIFYLDVNPLYDDEEGCLSKEFTADHAHIKGKYYAGWVEYILQNAVREE